MMYTAPLAGIKRVMQNEHAKEVLEKLQSGYGLPSLSPVAIKLIELASNDASSARDLAGVVEKDPSLAVRVLKLANSAFFNSAYPVTTLQQAIMRIGFHQLRVLALSLSLRETFPMGKAGQIDYEEFWRSSLYRGLLARSLAHQLKTCDPEEAFVAGLTLEVGFLIFLELYMKRNEEIPGRSSYSAELLLSWETGRFGINHREIGEIALRYWKFPEKIVACQSFSFSEAQAGPTGLCRICRIAQDLSALICQPDADFHNIYRTVASHLGVGQEAVNEAMITTLKEVNETAEALKLEVESEKDTFLLLEKARETLGRLSEQIVQQQYNVPSHELPSFDTLKAREDQAETIVHTLEAVAHEIRNPLTAVGGFARRLAKTMDPSSDNWRYVEAILQEAQKLERSLNEMGSHLTKGKIQENPKEGGEKDESR
jgi:HD-like signal output (HDOD) protein